MGFRDVRHHHGSGELGKDIVMWTSDRLLIRDDYAVVVKRGRISGRSSGAGSAAEVTNQVRKALGSTYHDAVTNQPHRPTRCWVVVSGEIGPDARRAIEADLSPELMRVVSFIDGDKLWELVQQHLLSESVPETLTRIQKTLDQASENYRVIAMPQEGGGWGFMVQPKHPDAEKVEPLEMKGTLAFPNTEEGQQEFKKVQHHIETGAPVIIDARYLQGFSLPEFLQRLIDPEGLGPGAVVLGPAVPAHPIAFRLVIEPESGEAMSHDHVLFDVLQQGTQQVTMKSQDHGLPWRFGFVVDFRNKLLHVDYSSRYAGANAETAVRAARFEKALAKGGLLKLEHAHTGLVIVSAQMPAGLASHMNDKALYLLERLALIQRKTGVVLNIGERLTPADSMQILQVAERVERGLIEWEPQPGIVSQNRSEATRLLEHFTMRPDQPFVLLPSKEEKQMVLGTEVPMGPSALVIVGFRMEPESAAGLHGLLADPAQTGPFEVNLSATPLASLTGLYERWLPPGQFDPKIFGH
jgi:hypothetical protein